MNYLRHGSLLCLLLVGSGLSAWGQDGHASEVKVSSAAVSGPVSEPTQDQGSLEQVPRVPGLSVSMSRFNAGLTVSAVHDATGDWYTMFTPAASFSFNSWLTADLSLSAYLKRPQETETTTQVTEHSPNGAPYTVTTTSTEIIQNNDLGDMMLGLHATAGNQKWRNMSTANLTLPTGSQDDGLSTGSVTFDFSNRLERSFGDLSFLVDVGVGNSAGLVNSLVSKQYDSLGPLSHYQTGLSFWLPGSMYFQSVMYEQLPFGRQTLYITQQTQNENGSSTTTTATSFSADDFGLTTFFSVPLHSHILLNGYYNRSLRKDYNTVAVGTTFVLHKIHRRARISMIDKALREAEVGDQ